ncbi:hypothetical protein ACH5RR_029270 [Cinchona calisaya]|uniref:Uncharacterized protein n=1 Tax=Cinchona calisaya TaxID=153742 RepID=A0ABD2YSU6_9GENT
MVDQRTRKPVQNIRDGTPFLWNPENLLTTGNDSIAIVGSRDHLPLPRRRTMFSANFGLEFMYEAIARNKDLLFKGDVVKSSIFKVDIFILLSCYSTWLWLEDLHCKKSLATLLGDEYHRSLDRKYLRPCARASAISGDLGSDFGTRTIGTVLLKIGGSKTETGIVMRLIPSDTYEKCQADILKEKISELQVHHCL